MAYTVQDILIKAMSVIGAVEMDETPDLSRLNKVMTTANFMLDHFSADAQMQRSTILEHYAIPSNAQSFTIGTGGSWNIQKPIKILGAFLQDSGGTRYDLEIVEKDVYESYIDALTTLGIPQAICYDPGTTQQANQLGTIYVYPMASGNYTLYTENQKYLTEFVNLTDVVTFEPAYYAMLYWNLAVWIYPEFYKGKDPSRFMMSQAKKTRLTIENMNVRKVSAKLDLPSTGKCLYDIYSDQGY